MRADESERSGVPRVVARDEVDAQVVVLSAPWSAAAEQYRVLARRLEPELRRGARRVGVTSAVAGEGRSTTAVNLALTLAGRMRVALVDGHLRAPSVARLLGLPPRVGLAEVVEGRAALDEALVRFGRDDLHVLAAGLAEEPHATYAARRLGELLAALGERFDAVIVDGPPALPTADMLSLADALDGALLVVRAGATRREVLALALERLPTRLLGAVLHRVDVGAGDTWRLCARHDKERRKPHERELPPLLPTAAGAGAQKG